MPVKVNELHPEFLPAAAPSWNTGDAEKAEGEEDGEYAEDSEGAEGAEDSEYAEDPEGTEDAEDIKGAADAEDATDAEGFENRLMMLPSRSTKTVLIGG